ncbi:hypothetical protein MZM54_05070 [[Brevibacterium] frigoritolerans]|nr:hypothetical protein [Peribacillus frigoritolerans]
MKATVIFKIGETEIKTIAQGPVLSTIPEAGKKHMTVLNAISKIKKETGIDLNSIDEDISEKATVIFD